MAGGLRVAQAVVGVIKEAVAYTYSEPTVAFPAYDINFTPSGDNYQRKETSTVFAKLPSLPGMGMAEIGFKIPMVGASAAGVVPYYDVAMLAAGLSSDDYTGPPEKIRYKPMTTFDGGTDAGPPAITRPSKAYSVSFWNDGVRYSLKGGMCNLIMSAKAGEPVELAFQFKGAYETVIDDAPPTPTVSTLTPPRFLGATLSVHGASLVCESWSLDLGNVLSNIVDANDAAGIKGALITDRRPKIKVDPEMELVATHDFFAKWRAATSGVISWGTIGSAAGNVLAFNAGATIINPPSLSEREGMRTLDLEYDVVSTSVTEGDEFYIEIT